MLSSSKIFSARVRTVLTGGPSAALLCLFGMTTAKFETHEIFGSCLFFAGTLLAGVAVTGRAWSLMYISGKKNASLVTVGPYSLCRNPLYFFSIRLFPIELTPSREGCRKRRVLQREDG